MSTETLNIIIAIGSVGTLIGVLVNAWFTRSVKIEFNHRMSEFLDLTKEAYLAKGRKQVEDEQSRSM